MARKQNTFPDELIDNAIKTMYGRTLLTLGSGGTIGLIAARGLRKLHELPLMTPQMVRKSPQGRLFRTAGWGAAAIIAAPQLRHIMQVYGLRKYTTKKQHEKLRRALIKNLITAGGGGLGILLASLGHLKRKPWMFYSGLALGGASPIAAALL